MPAYIKEESFFMCLTWLYPVLSGIIVSVLLCEHHSLFLNYNESHTSLIWYSSCSKIPILWEEFEETLFNTVIGLSHMAVVSITIFIQIAIFIRQRQLEKQKADGIFLIIYKRDGVTISRRSSDQPSCHKLSRHNRSVVTPRASFMSFIIIFSYYLLISLIGVPWRWNLLKMGASGPSILGEGLVFLLPSVMFFLYLFIETICSPTLRNSLSDVFPCQRSAYHVVNI